MIKAAVKIGYLAKGVKGDGESIYSGSLLPCVANVLVEGIFATLHCDK